MIKQARKTRQDILRIQELRRSNASSPMKNKKKYSRNTKHKNLTFDTY